MIRLIQKAENYPNRVAIKSGGKDFSYQQLLTSSKNIALTLLDGNDDLHEARVAFLVSPGFSYVAIQWGIWRAGGIAVPLCIKHPLPSIKYVIQDSEVDTVVYDSEYKSFLSPLMDDPNTRYLHSEMFRDFNDGLPEINSDRRAMILYTSGTTGSPKGVVTSHQNIESQITALTTSWEWNENDHILNVLPMHHVHGIINVLSCALWSGACCEFLLQFDAQKVFDIFCLEKINVFMAVPTIYYKLIAHYNNLPIKSKENISIVLQNFRFMVSGSAALPVSVLEQWKEISGHTLLERYGMTEIGMAISNSYRGQRIPGHIGLPLPKVEVRIVDENNQVVLVGEQGEIQVKGPSVFKEYWGKPQATKESFTADEWFKTGDIAALESIANEPSTSNVPQETVVKSYKILGRNSVDIIKSGGYKISALEIEEILRTFPGINECAVVGIPDDEWGEIIGASLILENNIDLEELKAWLKEQLPGYKIPRRYIIQDDLPRNVMGKVTKKELKKLFILDA